VCPANVTAALRSGGGLVLLAQPLPPAWQGSNGVVMVFWQPRMPMTKNSHGVIGFLVFFAEMISSPTEVQALRCFASIFLARGITISFA
jgi:hypothetical protein